MVLHSPQRHQVNKILIANMTSESIQQVLNSPIFVETFHQHPHGYRESAQVPVLQGECVSGEVYALGEVGEELMIEGLHPVDITTLHCLGIQT